MADAEDPYRSPSSSPEIDSPAERDPSAPRRIVRNWEKLRIYYNIIVLFTGLSGAALLGSLRELVTLAPAVVGYGIMANLCFFAGPLAELYLTAIHFTDDFRTGRLILFSAGVFISVVFTLILLVGTFFNIH